MSDVNLSKAVRSNLLSLQSTATNMAKTQERLATGLKVNSALDNPTNFFTAASLTKPLSTSTAAGPGAVLPPALAASDNVSTEGRAGGEKEWEKVRGGMGVPACVGISNAVPVSS